jgi:hypothetical protein
MSPVKTRGYKMFFFFVSFLFVSEKYIFRFGFRFRFQKIYRSVSFRFLKNNVSFRFCKIIFGCIKAQACTKKKDDFIFCLFWLAQQQNPYNL